MSSAVVPKAKYRVGYNVAPPVDSCSSCKTVSTLGRIDGDIEDERIRLLPPYSSCKNLSVNWDLIDHNLLELIAKRLAAVDYINFRSVCKTWRSISIEPDRLPLPWLITGCDRVDGRLFYISFTDGKPCSIAVPALKENKSLELGIVSCQGWLLLQGQHDSRAISLLNPLIDAHLHLPDAPEDLFTRRIQYNVNFDPLNPEATVDYVEIQYFIHRMAMSSSPLSDCTIVVISAVSKALVSLRMGVDGSSWNLMDDRSKFEDVSFCHRSFLAVDCLGQVSIFSCTDLNKLRMMVGSPSMHLQKAEWKFYDVSTEHIVLFRKVSYHEGYLSFKNKKLPFYKTRRVWEFTLFGDCTGGPGQVKLRRVHIRNSLSFYGISSQYYNFLYVFNGMSDSTYIAGEHGEVPGDDGFVFYITGPKAFHMNNDTLKPLFPQLRNNLISLWHMPQPF